MAVPRPLRCLAVALVAAGLCGCGAESDDGEADDAPASTPPPATALVVKTRIHGFAGEVVSGSVLGGEPFCEGGTVQHEQGSPAIGFPAVNVLDCPDGQLRIGFGPGADQMEQVVQTSHWEVLEGSGGFAGASGEGEMEVEWTALGSDEGQETFTGTLELP